jgi:serine/threonine protein kinase
MEPWQAHDPLIDTVIDGRYRVIEPIAAGGMATVYRARQLNVGRDVAIKVIGKNLFADGRAVRRFETEARIISKLRHPNTLKLIDFGRLSDGRPYLVIELLIGESLDKRLGRPCDPEWTLKILRQICDALAEAHELGIVHRDLKPANIFLERVGNVEIVRVLDFGIAVLEQGDPNKDTDSLFGTPAFMSPEQTFGRRIDGRSDLYSLGIIAYYALTAELPFVSDSTPALLMMHLTEPVRPLRRTPHGGRIAPAIDALVLSLLQKKPEDRPPSARHLRDRIDRLLTSGSSLSTPRARRPEMDRRKGRLDMRRFAIPLFVAVTAACAGGWLLGRPANPSSVASTASQIVAERKPDTTLAASALPTAPSAEPTRAPPPGFIDFDLEEGHAAE